MMCGKTIFARADDIGMIIVDKNRLPGPYSETLQRQCVNGWIRLHQFFGSRHDYILKKVKYWLCRTEPFPEFCAKIGDRKQRHAAFGEFLHNIQRPCDGPWNGLIETVGVNRNQLGIFWKFSNPLGNHIVQSATRVMLKMPFGRHDMGDEKFQLISVCDQLGKKIAQVPFEKHFANIKHDCGYLHDHNFLIGRRKKTARESDSERHFVEAIRLQCAGRVKLTLARLKAWLGLVDDISATTAANHAVIAMAALERLQRINDFHRICPSNKCKKLELKGRSYGSGSGKSSAIGPICGLSPHRLLDVVRDSLKDVPMMKNARLLLLLAPSLLTACVVPTGPVEVTRFNRAAEGVSYGAGSFAVALVGESASDSTLSASPYLAAVAREMQRIGYRDIGGNADVVAEIRFGATMIRADRRAPISVGVGGSTGSYGSGLGIGLGINLSGGSAAQLQTTLAVRIVRRSDRVVIWEGTAVQLAKAGSPAAQPGIAASKLAESLFKDFPGVSGATIRVP